MASVIKPKRSAVANTPPTTANIEQYEIAINTADKKIYTRDGSDNIITIGAGNLSGLTDVALSSLADTQILSYNAATSKWINIDNYATQVKEIVKNSTGATLAKGTVVYVSGATGANILVAKAQANAEATSSRTFGILEADIANGASGYCVRSGKLSGLDTSTYAEGDPIYLSPTTAGGFVVGVANKPSAPNHLVYLGVVTRSQAINGEIQVSISNGWELDEIHDVQIGTKASGNTLIYDATSSTWKNANLTAGTDISVTNGAGSITIADTSTLASVTGRGATTSSAISITNSTASSSASTGALTITGGVGIGGQLWVGQGSTGGLRTTNLQIYDDGNPHITSSAGNLWLNSPNADKVSINAQSNGSIELAKAGGGNVQVLSTTASTSTTSGALVVAGGVGIAGAAYVGGAANFKGEVLIDNSSGAGGTVEGGELRLAVGTTGNTLSGPIAIDIYANKLRIFETSGTNRGVYIDLTTAGAGVGTNLMSGGGTVTSVSGTGTVAGLSLSGTVTTSGSLTLSGTLSTPVSTINDSTTVGQNLVKLTNPSAITFLRVNADNTVSALDAATFRTAIGAGTSSTTGTVTSVSMTVPTGLTVTGSPITTSGTLAITLTTGYSIPTTASQTNWDTAYTDRNKWDGGATGLTASTGRTSLGATTIGSNLFTLTNPSAITFLRVNADNTVSTLDAATFRTAIGAGTSSTTGTVTSVGGTGTVAGLSLSGTVTTSGNLTLSGTLSTPVSTINDSTTVGQNLVKLTNPSAVTFLRVNADNTVSALSAASFLTAIGAQASGSYLTANQTITLSGDVTGSGSTAITATLSNSGVTAGTYSLASITVDSKGRITAASSGSVTSLIGTTSSSAPYTVALGQSAGTNSTGTGNIAIGYQALDAGNSGGYGIAIGYNAASSATTSTSFVAIGLNAMLNPLSGGAYGVYIGESAGRSITSGSSHVAIGYNAGYSMTSSNADTVVGYNALSSYSGPQGTNVAIGANAGSSLTAGGNNIIIGESAQASSTTVSNEITLGNASITKLRVPGVGFYVGTESIASAATITPDSTDSQYNITALATDATLAAPAAGKDGQQLRIRIKDNGTARAITWTTSSGGYRAIGTTLFTSTVAGKTIYVGCIYNAADSFWDVVSVSTQA